MIDPNDVTKFQRSDDELLEFWLFCLFVRGKNADVQAAKLATFAAAAKIAGNSDSIVRALRHTQFKTIEGLLRGVKSGQYNTLAAAINETMLHLGRDRHFLRHATVRELEDITGVGPKTSRFFILHSRPKARVAVLDTHILRYLSDRGDLPVPKTTPPAGKRYDMLEQAFLLYADHYGADPAKMDLAIWRASRETYPMDWHRFYEEMA